LAKTKPIKAMISGPLCSGAIMYDMYRPLFSLVLDPPCIFVEEEKRYRKRKMLQLKKQDKDFVFQLVEVDAA
jgi:hypothetical protein